MVVHLQPLRMCNMLNILFSICHNRLSCGDCHCKCSLAVSSSVGVKLDFNSDTVTTVWQGPPSRWPTVTPINTPAGIQIGTTPLLSPCRSLALTHYLPHPLHIPPLWLRSNYTVVTTEHHYLCPCRLSRDGSEWAWRLILFREVLGYAKGSYTTVGLTCLFHTICNSGSSAAKLPTDGLHRVKTLPFHFCWVSYCTVGVYKTLGCRWNQSPSL